MPLRRDLDRLRRAAELVRADLDRTLGASWSCTVGAGPVLTVAHGDRREDVLLDADVADDFDPASWPEVTWTAEHRDATLDDDAAEAVASDVVEVLRLWGRTWPVCSGHGRRLEQCSGVWVCDGPPGHETLLGAL